MAPPPPLFDAPTQSSPSRCSTHLWRRSCLLPSFYPIILLKNMAVEKNERLTRSFFIEKNPNLSTTIILVPFPLLPSFSVAWPFKPSDIHYVSLRLLAYFQRNNAVSLNPFDTPTATPSFPPSVRLPERTATTYCLVLASIKLWWNKKNDQSTHTLISLLFWAHWQPQPPPPLSPFFASLLLLQLNHSTFLLARNLDCACPFSLLF